MDKVMEIVIVWGKYVGVELIPLAPCSSTYSSSGIWCVDMSKYGWMVCGTTKRIHCYSGRIRTVHFPNDAFYLFPCLCWCSSEPV